MRAADGGLYAGELLLDLAAIVDVTGRAGATPSPRRRRPSREANRGLWIRRHGRDHRHAEEGGEAVEVDGHACARGDVHHVEGDYERHAGSMSWTVR